jgi:hypothetical protein
MQQSVAAAIFAESKKELKNIFQNVYLAVFTIISLLFNLFLWFFILLSYQNIKDFTIIHYSALSGVDWVDEKKNLFVYPLIGSVVFLINFILIFYFYRRQEKFIFYSLAITTLLINLVCLIGFFLVRTL